MYLDKQLPKPDHGNQTVESPTILSNLDVQYSYEKRDHIGLTIH